MRRLIILLALILTCACGAALEPTAEVAAPLYVDAVGGGHGPFSCVGPTPGRGYVDLYTGSGAAAYTGTCQRWRGDMADGTGYQHQGFAFWLGMTVGSMRVSPHGTDQTMANVCAGWVDTSPPYSCTGGASVNATSDQPSFPFYVDQIRLQYTSYCPVTAAFTHLQQGTGAAAIEDGSQLATVRITDAFGNPLFEPNNNSLAVDCVTYLPTRLMSQFTPPTGYLFGNEVAAVYTYP